MVSVGTARGCGRFALPFGDVTLATPLAFDGLMAI